MVHDIRYVEESGYYLVLVDDVIMLQTRNKMEAEEYIRRLLNAKYGNGKE